MQLQYNQNTRVMTINFDDEWEESSFVSRAVNHYVTSAIELELNKDAKETNVKK